MLNSQCNNNDKNIFKKKKKKKKTFKINHAASRMSSVQSIDKKYYLYPKVVNREKFGCWRQCHSVLICSYE